MSCCGKSRAQASQSSARPVAARVQPKISVATTAPPFETVAFEYIGDSRLTVIGLVTRTRYEFQGHGARLNVDRRDSNSLSTVPTLKRVWSVLGVS